MEDANFTAWDGRLNKIQEQRLLRVRSIYMAASKIMIMR